MGNYFLMNVNHVMEEMAGLMMMIFSNRLYLLFLLGIVVMMNKIYYSIKLLLAPEHYDLWEENYYIQLNNVSITIDIFLMIIKIRMNN